MRTFTNFLVGAIMGALVGATAAILLAPSSGDTLRGEIRDRGNRFMDQMREAAAEQRAELEGQLDKLRAS